MLWYPFVLLKTEYRKDDGKKYYNICNDCVVGGMF